MRFLVGAFLIGSILFLPWAESRGEYIQDQENKKIENILAQENINYANLQSHSNADYDFVVRPADNGSKKVRMTDKYNDTNTYFFIDKDNKVKVII